MANPTHWDERYASPDFVYGRAPNEFFKAFLTGRKPGTLLLPCEGEGRNAAWAAGQGWKVSAFDQSRVGMEKANQLAREEGVNFAYTIADAASYNPGFQRFNLIAFIWAHFPPAQRRQIHQQYQSFLVPGGHLIVEGFSKQQLRFTSGGPRDPEMLLDRDSLALDFPLLEMLQLEETFTLLEEGDFHRGQAAVVRYAGRLPSVSPVSFPVERFGFEKEKF